MRPRTSVIDAGGDVLDVGDVQWFSQDDLAEQTGLYGPLVHEFLSWMRLPLADDGCDASTAVYTFDALVKAHVAAVMLQVGIRFPLIRAAMHESTPVQESLHDLAMWLQHPALQRPGLLARLRVRWGHGRR